MKIIKFYKLFTCKNLVSKFSYIRLGIFCGCFLFSGVLSLLFAYDENFETMVCSDNSRFSNLFSLYTHLYFFFCFFFLTCVLFFKLISVVYHNIYVYIDNHTGIQANIEYRIIEIDMDNH